MGVRARRCVGTTLCEIIAFASAQIFDIRTTINFIISKARVEDLFESLKLKCDVQSSGQWLSWQTGALESIQSKVFDH